MKFSVIVPVYNAEAFIDECIASILSQTYRDFEIVLVDDGSTDNSGTICDQYALANPQIVKVVHGENRGQLQARCCGVRQASGSIVLFVDSDDCLRDDALERINECFLKTQCDMLLFNGSREKDYSLPYLNLPFDDGQCFSGAEKNRVYEVMIVTSALNSLCLKAVRLDMVMECAEKHACFDGRNGEDLLQSIPLVSRAGKIAYLGENLYCYRVRPGSVVHTYNPARHRSIKTVHQEMEKYIDIWDMQHLHPRHYTREVRGWVECLKQLMRNAAGNEAAQLLQELAEDDYFRNAYQKMAAEELSRRDALLAKWLYERKYRWLMLMGGIVRPMDKLRNCLKTK